MLSAAHGALVLEAREVHRKADGRRLAALAETARATANPLAPWVDYWDIGLRLDKASPQAVDAFFARWPGSYVEDRLRNDWLLELGRRRDWATFAVQFPRFRMNDDPEVTCYALLGRHLAGEAVTEAARRAWMARREADDGCHLLAQTLWKADLLGPSDAWQKVRLAFEAGRQKVARQAAELMSVALGGQVDLAFTQPEKFLKRPSAGKPSEERPLRSLAVMRWARNEPDDALRELTQPWARALPGDLAALTWAGVARQAALQQHPQAAEAYARAFDMQRRTGQPPEWSEEVLSWGVRAALRSARNEAERWSLIAESVQAMTPAQRADPAWVYWYSRALRALAAAGGTEADGRAAEARRLLESIASPLHFYGKLAADELARVPALPPSPAPLTPEERLAARQHPGLTRALDLMALGLRPEGVREWNFSLRGMDDRALLAAAERACEREVWDRCINTSDRTRQEIHLGQRFPMPFRAEVVAAAKEIGLDPAVVYGLIRQESRFITDARSHVGASGLMQLMPATAQWTARKIGLNFTPAMITDHRTNLRLGTSYLKMVLEDFEGSMAMAAAAYNAGPSRPRRWREGARLETAAWAETIPFNETRDYVKKVLSNASIYAALIEGAAAPALKPRLGGPIGPRQPGGPAYNQDLP